MRWNSNSLTGWLAKKKKKDQKVGESKGHPCLAESRGGSQRPGEPGASVGLDLSFKTFRARGAPASSELCEALLRTPGLPDGGNCRNCGCRLGKTSAAGSLDRGWHGPGGGSPPPKARWAWSPSCTAESRRQSRQPDSHRPAAWPEHGVPRSEIHRKPTKFLLNLHKQKSPRSSEQSLT